RQHYTSLIRNVADPITTPHNFTPGAAAYQAGVPAGLATAIQLLSSVLVLGAGILAALPSRPDAAPLAASVADAGAFAAPTRRVPARGDGGEPAPLAGAVGPLRDAAAAPGRLAPRAA